MIKPVSNQLLVNLAIVTPEFFLKHFMELHNDPKEAFKSISKAEYAPSEDFLRAQIVAGHTIILRGEARKALEFIRDDIRIPFTVQADAKMLLEELEEDELLEASDDEQCSKRWDEDVILSDEDVDVYLDYCLDSITEDVIDDEELKGAILETLRIYSSDNIHQLSVRLGVSIPLLQRVLCELLDSGDIDCQNREFRISIGHELKDNYIYKLFYQGSSNECSRVEEMNQEWDDLVFSK